MNKFNNFDSPAKVIKREGIPDRVMYSLTFKEAFVNYFTSRFSKDNFRRFIKENFPNKEDSRKEIVRKLIMDISFVLLVLGLSYMVFYYFTYRERIKDLGEWETKIETIDESEMFDFEIKQLWDNIRKQYPDVDFPEGMNLKFAKLYAVNQDTVGVLKIDGKDFWYPLMQRKSAPTYYLWKNMYGDYSRYGNPYVDYRADMSKDGLSKNTIIYGHNTHDKLGFNKLTAYMKLDGYKEAPVITVETLYQKTQWKIFGVMLTNSTSAADRGHLFSYLITDFASDKDFMTMIDGIKQRSMIKTGVDVKASDKILTLYTCYQDIFEGGRLVVFARLVREGESAEVDVSKASFNYSARYPQAYYDQLGLKNPYEDLTKPIYYIEDANGNLIPVETTDIEESTVSQDSTTAAAAPENTTSAGGASVPPENPSQQTAPSGSEGTTAAPPVSAPENTTAAPSVQTPENTTAAPPVQTPENTTAAPPVQAPQSTTAAPPAQVPENTTAAPAAAAPVS